eukprot:scaffold3588_cov67-Phaeocystis_antarctica.AAC.11
MRAAGATPSRAVARALWERPWGRPWEMASKVSLSHGLRGRASSWRRWLCILPCATRTEPGRARSERRISLAADQWVQGSNGG